MADGAELAVDVVYALADRQTMIRVLLSPEGTVADAIEKSAIAGRHPEIDLQSGAVGIFGRRVPLSTRPRDGDRIEIYRPLQVEPKQSRRTRVRKKTGK